MLASRILSDNIYLTIMFVTPISSLVMRLISVSFLTHTKSRNWLERRFINKWLMLDSSVLRLFGLATPKLKFAVTVESKVPRCSKRSWFFSKFSYISTSSTPAKSCLGKLLMRKSFDLLSTTIIYEFNTLVSDLIVYWPLSIYQMIVTQQDYLEDGHDFCCSNLSFIYNIY